MIRKLPVLATAAVIAVAVAMPTAPAKAGDGWAIAAGVAGGLLLTGLAVNAAYGYPAYPNYPYYGPRYGSYVYGYPGYWGPSYRYGAYYGPDYVRGPGYSYASFDGPTCYWTRRPGAYGWRAARVCY